MTLDEFLTDLRVELQTEVDERLTAGSGAYPYRESVFAEIVMDHMAEIGMTFDPQACHLDMKLAQAKLRLSGYAISDDADQLDLFVSLFADSDVIVGIPDTDTRAAADQCLKFLASCAKGTLEKAIDASHEAVPLASTIRESYDHIEQIRIYVLTDGQAKSKNFKSKELNGKLIRLEVMDIERLYRHWSEGKPRDELVVSFEEISGGALPCVYVPGGKSEYDYALTAVPGEALRFIYERFGARLLEANVRSFLSVTGKVNKGIRDTLRDRPERFMAYNNGIVVVADEARFNQTPDGIGLAWLKGMQIVNGGQTTASIYFAMRKDRNLDLSQVRVPAKIIVLRKGDAASEESLIADISRYANSQNAVKQSDLSANKPFHIELEKLSTTIYCPNGVSRWFYERAAGSYTTMLAREGTTPARLKQLKQVVCPPSQRVTKTDLARYLNAWGLKPDLVSLGLQKNFEQFMDALKDQESEGPVVPDAAYFKMAIAKAILFRKTHTVVRPMFKAAQLNVATYLIALISERYGKDFDFDRIWERQDISDQLRHQISTWAIEVHEIFVQSSAGRILSEWAKKPECWDIVRNIRLSPIQAGRIPEIRG